MMKSLLPFLTVCCAPEQMLTALALIVFGGAAAFAVVLKLFGAYRPGAPAAVAIVAAFVLSPFDWSALLVVAIPFTLGFVAGRSTHVPVHPLRILERTKLHPIDYFRHQENLLNMHRSGGLDELLESQRVHPT